MKPNSVVPRVAGPLVLTLAVMVLGGCGSGAAPLAAESAPSTATSQVSTPEPTATSPSAAPAVATTTGTASATTSSASSSDVADATRSALGLFEKVPRNAQDPSAGYVWFSVATPGAPLSPAVVARMDTLRNSGYFGAMVCGVDYLTGTQNGLSAAPAVVSARRDPGGTVTVVIRRPATPAPPDLTVVMTHTSGVWLAADLASGSGPSASIFAAKPHC